MLRQPGPVGRETTHARLQQSTTLEGAWCEAASLQALGIPERTQDRVARQLECLHDATVAVDGVERVSGYDATHLITKCFVTAVFRIGSQVQVDELRAAQPVLRVGLCPRSGAGQVVEERCSLQH